MKASLACLLFAFLFLAPPARAMSAPPPQPIALYVDGKSLEFTSQVVSRPLPPLLVDGYAMVPVRLLDEVFDAGLDLHMLDWGILRVGDLTFRLGVREVRRPRPMVGGAVREKFPLPVAPRVINGRFYVPARSVLSLLGHGVEWDATNRALHILRDQAPPSGPRTGSSSRQSGGHVRRWRNIPALQNGDLLLCSGDQRLAVTPHWRGVPPFLWSDWDGPRVP